VPNHPPRYDSLDLWRGVAALVVILHHAALYSPFWMEPGGGCESPASGVVALFARGWLGVPLFFVVSGYCVLAAADNNRLKGRGVLAYFARRLRRIYPPYWAALALVLLLWPVFGGLWAMPAWGFPPPADLTAWQWLGNATLTEGWRHRAAGDGPLLFLGPAWSLVYEEQFYLVVGLLLLARRLFAGVALVTLAAVALNLSGANVRGLFLDLYWLAFAAGAACYWALVRAGPRGRACVALALAAGVAALSPHWRTLAALHVSPEAGALAGVALALLLLLLRPLDSRLARARPLAPLSWVGVRCYSVYLVHWPVCKVVGAGLYSLGVRGDLAVLLTSVPLSLALSLLVGHWFHAAVERRFLNAPGVTNSTATPGPRSSAGCCSPRTTRV
jgi:peptidoglycan/LPS O-acetylase OafA/YrhL